MSHLRHIYVCHSDNSSVQNSMYQIADICYYCQFNSLVGRRVRDIGSAQAADNSTFCSFEHAMSVQHLLQWNAIQNIATSQITHLQIR